MLGICLNANKKKLFVKNFVLCGKFKGNPSDLFSEKLFSEFFFSIGNDLDPISAPIYSHRWELLPLNGFGKWIKAEIENEKFLRSLSFGSLLFLWKCGLDFLIFYGKLGENF